MRYLKFLVMIAFLTGFTFMMGCNKDGGDEMTDEEKQLEKLVFTWNLSSASLDGADRTADWTNFALTVTGTPTSKTYTTSGSGDENVWPSSGSWDFATTTGSGLNTINRSDNVSISISNLTTSTMDLSFKFVLARTEKEGRLASIEGDWVFKFTR